MSDDVSYAANLGASINRGLGSINAPKKKKPKDKDDKVTDKPAETAQPEPAKAKTESPKVKKDSLKKTKAPSTPIMVKSERINKPAEPSGPKPIMYNYKDLPTSSTSTEKTPTVGRQFTKYAGMYGTDNQPPIDLSKL
jgi:hypothetical protein